MLDHELQVGTWALNLFAINVLMSGKGNQSGDSGVIWWTFEYQVEVSVTLETWDSLLGQRRH